MLRTISSATAGPAAPVGGNPNYGGPPDVVVMVVVGEYWTNRWPRGTSPRRPKTPDVDGRMKNDPSHPEL